MALTEPSYSDIDSWWKSSISLIGDKKTQTCVILIIEYQSKYMHAICRSVSLFSVVTSFQIIICHPKNQCVLLPLLLSLLMHKLAT